MVHDYREFFGPHGPLAEQVVDYAPRPQQQAMAEAVGRALDELCTLVVEAGTGVGKTFAYLVPALLSGRRVIISTGTRNLQDQLFHRDLPTVRAAIGSPAKVALLKGRANYLCHHRLGLALVEAEESEDLAAVAEWSRRTRSGDVSELREVPEHSPLWPRVTSTVDNCLGQSCPELGRCHVVKARRAAADADVVIVNHHLLLADLALKEEGFGELLARADACIVDEAHQMPETASRFFGISLGSRQLTALVRDCTAELLQAGHSDAAAREPGDALVKAVNDLGLRWAGASGRQAWEGERAGAADALAALCARLEGLAESLQPLADESPGLENCARRAATLAASLERFACAGVEEGLRWVDVTRRGFVLHLTPLDVAERLGGIIAANATAWVFTSATLAVGDDFGHFTGRIGAGEALSLKLDSPFDFKRNALLYIPESMPDPGARSYTRRVCETARPLIAAAGGAAFLLFTSHRALAEAARLLSEDDELAFPMFVQGSAPREALLERFRRHGHAVLLGTSSFWEGVDVRGEALRLVVIDKLPFGSPGDPVLQARLEAIRRAGGNPFTDYQLPQAVLSLKQGIGRLIRDPADTGVAVVCDPRLRSRGYGRVFLRSLPPLTQTGSAAQCEAFLRRTRPAMPPDVSRTA